MILVINSGSSSIKFAIYATEDLSLQFQDEIEHKFTQQSESMAVWLNNLTRKYSLSAAGHRVVHGGSEFYQPIIITPEVIEQLKKYIPLAPLHQPHNLEAIEAISKINPDLLQVACFDTAFHKTQIKLATLFAIPRDLTASGIIRYGFHGLSYEYIASILQDKIGGIAQRKVIVAHLGNGASMCGMQDLKSVATTMGFTAIEGLMMGTRSGSIDPGVLLYLVQEKGYTADTLTKLLYEQSGLLGVSEISFDVRQILASNTAAATEAIDLFCYRAARELGALVTTLKGCDVIVFTAGIGENSATIRQKICAWLDWLGLNLDLQANQNNSTIISSKDSKILVSVIATNEELMIAKHTKKLIK